METETLMEKAEKLILDAKIANKEQVVVYTTTSDDYTTTNDMLSWDNLKDDVKDFYQNLMTIYGKNLKTNLKDLYKGEVEYIILLPYVSNKLFL
jgi:protein involved in sex pheromone biosynthesis